MSLFALAVLAGSTMFAPIAHAHGNEPLLVPLAKTLEDFGAAVRWDSYSEVFSISRNSTLVRAKVGSSRVLVNGQALQIDTPISMRGDVAYMSHDFISQVFQSSLDKTFAVEKTPSPLNPLSAEEINAAIAILKAAGKYQTGYRFAEISLKTPPKAQVWNFALVGTPVTAPRQADLVILDGKKVIEGTVDFTTRSVTRWAEIQGVHGMVLASDSAEVMTALQASTAYAQALAKRGIFDLGKIVVTLMTVGYFDGKDALSHDDRLLKVASYVDVGDGNYWAHPVENLIVVVDLDKKKVIRIEDGAIVPVPLMPTPYDGRNRAAFAQLKPLEINEPEGKNYTIAGNTLHWRNWDFHVRLDSRVGLLLSTVTYNDKGTRRKIMYEGSLGGMIVPYGDPDVGWYFKAYLDAGEYGMGTMTSPIVRGRDAPGNAVLIDATLADHRGAPVNVPRAIAVFERHAGPDFKHHEMGKPNVSAERRELVVRWISTVGNYDYIFDWVFAENGTIGIDVGATGIEAVKGVMSRTMQDSTAVEDTRYGTLLDHNIVGTTHQHIYNFRLDLDVDGESNSLTEVDPVVADNVRGGPRTSTMQTVQRTVPSEKAASQKFDPSTIRLMSNPNRLNKVGNPVSYQLIPYAGGTHPIAKGANFAKDEWSNRRFSFMNRQLWVTRYNPDERFPEGKYPNRSDKDTGLGQFTADDQSIVDTDTVVWMTTGTTHVTRSEEWPIMPTEWVHALLKPWNYFDETPTLSLNKSSK